MTVIAVALTFASGAMDVASFTRLGSVFTSVMTGNIVLWGLAVARGSLTLASHTAVAIVGYIAGVAGGSRIAVGVQGAGARGAKGTERERNDGETRAGEGRAGAWPAHVTWALLAELALLGGFAAGWEVTAGRPGDWVQFCLLAVAAAGMGVQSSAVKNMGLTEVSTTYLTGTLTGLVSSLVSPGPPAQDRWRRLGVLLGLAAGASFTGLLIATAPDGVPALPLAALITALVLAWRPPRTEQDRGSLSQLGHGKNNRMSKPWFPKHWPVGRFRLQCRLGAPAGMGRERVMRPVWAVVRAAAELSGRIRVPGRIWCTMIPRILPQARILP